jgi:hypothetical protein
MLTKKCMGIAEGYGHAAVLLSSITDPTATQNVGGRLIKSVLRNIQRLQKVYQ